MHDGFNKTIQQKKEVWFPQLWKPSSFQPFFFSLTLSPFSVSSRRSQFSDPTSNIYCSFVFITWYSHIWKSFISGTTTEDPPRSVSFLVTDFILRVSIFLTSLAHISSEIGRKRSERYSQTRQQMHHLNPFWLLAIYLAHGCSIFIRREKTGSWFVEVNYV